MFPRFFHKIRRNFTSILRLFYFISLLWCLQRRNMCYTKAKSQKYERYSSKVFYLLASAVGRCFHRKAEE